MSERLAHAEESASANADHAREAEAKTNALQARLSAALEDASTFKTRATERIAAHKAERDRLVGQASLLENKQGELRATAKQAEHRLLELESRCAALESDLASAAAHRLAAQERASSLEAEGR
eukprot:CAMPEP_0119384742 /NCGR_PEP_ID=MMETSP1334-20130426/87375_1 /TAXON_ID=127549 /ORGANISM="Calcidiscus leptoporus, Strain RCC1130" /LENGTH=122 /DNA_ID=CAMNT_0007405847 /DNA_START=42 /DNA_END=406 /DNA_ORIENTATION=+